MSKITTQLKLAVDKTALAFTNGYRTLHNKIPSVANFKGYIEKVANSVVSGIVSALNLITSAINLTAFKAFFTNTGVKLKKVFTKCRTIVSRTEMGIGK